MDTLHAQGASTIAMVDFGSIIGVARIFDWGGPNHKSHAMTSLEILKKGTFCRAKISQNGIVT